MKKNQYRQEDKIDRKIRLASKLALRHKIDRINDHKYYVVDDEDLDDTNRTSNNRAEPIQQAKEN